MAWSSMRLGRVGLGRMALCFSWGCSVWGVVFEALEQALAKQEISDVGLRCCGGGEDMEWRNISNGAVPSLLRHEVLGPGLGWA